MILFSLSTPWPFGQPETDVCQWGIPGAQKTAPDLEEVPDIRHQKTSSWFLGMGRSESEEFHSAASSESPLSKKMALLYSFFLFLQFLFYVFSASDSGVLWFLGAFGDDPHISDAVRTINTSSSTQDLNSPGRKPPLFSCFSYRNIFHLFTCRTL